MDEEGRWFLEVELAPGEDAMKIADMATRDVDIPHLGRSERTGSDFGRRTTVSKMLSNRITCYRQII